MHESANQTAARNLIVETGKVTPPVGVIEWFDDGGEMVSRDNTNTLYNNATKDDRSGTGTREMFWRARRSWTRTYRNTPVGVDGRHKFHESEYLQKYGRWLN